MIEKVINAGVSLTDDIQKQQNIRLINKVSFFVFFVILSHTVLSFIIKSPIAVYLHLVGMATTVVIIILNNKGKYETARFVTLLLGNLFVGAVSILFGNDSRVVLYLFACILTPLFFYHIDEKPYILFFTLLSVFLAGGVQLYYNFFPPLADLSEGITSFLSFVSVIGSLIMVFVFFLYFYQEREKLSKSLKTLSETDSMTGLPNKRKYEKSLEYEWQRAARTGSYISLIVIDVDFFKKYNDFYGHKMGDEALVKVACAIKSSCRRIWDLPARYGGEEFVVLIPESDSESASIFCEYIRQNINLLQIPHESHENREHVTCSYGICSQRPKEGGHWEDLFRKADEALYEAKKSGRDCIKVKGSL